ncbi:hypothetical protein LCGC14_1477100 [marine sediment metagenome]|uniref:DUF6874 domain-containing protein n=1 Tax=marine sediment metagenome TaxID=412755 RepID=A0A0F9MCD2_9ZZZZ
MINWNSTREDIELAGNIAARAVAADSRLNRMETIMDIEACHLNGNPLRLSDLLQADGPNFAHDVYGIRANLDRESGELLNCFVPRYSA